MSDHITSYGDNLPTAVQQNDFIDPALLQQPQLQSSAIHNCQACPLQFESQIQLAEHEHSMHGTDFSTKCGCNFCRIAYSESNARAADIVSQPQPQSTQSLYDHVGQGQQYMQHFEGPGDDSQTGAVAEAPYPSGAHGSPVNQPPPPPQQQQQKQEQRVAKALRLPQPTDIYEHFHPQPLKTLNDNLTEATVPLFTSKIEIGTFNPKTRTWDHSKRAKPRPLTNPTTGRIIRSPATGNPLNDIPFLPMQIAENEPHWRLNYWLRKAAEEGIYMGIIDIIDRIPAWSKALRAGASAEADRRTTMSNRIQRYDCAIGQLPVVEKRHKGLPAKHAMWSIEGLTVLQGRLNTWWLPNHFGREGPWVVVQPAMHPGYDEEVKVGAPLDEGHCLVVEQAYGLSERVAKISDGLIFLDGLAVENGWEAKKEGREAVRTELKERDLDEEFEVWQRGGYNPKVGAAHTQKALEHAQSEAEVLAVLWGDNGVIKRLQTSPEPIGELPCVWETMTLTRAAFLLSIAKAHAEQAALPDSAIEHAEAAEASSRDCEMFEAPQAHHQPYHWPSHPQSEPGHDDAAPAPLLGEQLAPGANKDAISMPPSLANQNDGSAPYYDFGFLNSPTQQNSGDADPTEGFVNFNDFDLSQIVAYNAQTNMGVGGMDLDQT